MVSVGKDYRQTLFSAQYVKIDSQTVQWCFRCRGCDGTIQEVDLAEDLVDMVDGET